MAKQNINVGASANDGSGDSLRAAGTKINSNFDELYERVATAETGIAGKQASSAKLTAIAAASPIADGPHTVAGITITTVGGIITAIS